MDLFCHTCQENCLEDDPCSCCVAKGYEVSPEWFDQEEE